MSLISLNEPNVVNKTRILAILKNHTLANFRNKHLHQQTASIRSTSTRSTHQSEWNGTTMTSHNKPQTRPKLK